MPAADLAQRGGSTQGLGKMTQGCKTHPEALAPRDLKDAAFQCQPHSGQGGGDCRDAQAHSSCTPSVPLHISQEDGSCQGIMLEAAQKRE